MAKNSLAKSLFAFAACAFIVVGAVAGIKYVLESDGNDDDSSIYIPPATSEPNTSEVPTTSELPATSETPSTSEETSQDVKPRLYGDFPSNLFDDPYEDYLQPGQNSIVLALNPSMKPSNIAANSYGVYLDTLVHIDNKHTDEQIPVAISANSLRYDNSSQGYRLGFSDKTINADISIDPIFHSNYLGTYWTYTSVLVFDFSITNINGLLIDVENKMTPISIYYRTKTNTIWNVFEETGVNTFETYGDDFFDYNEEIQLAVAYHSNTKSTNFIPGAITLEIPIFTGTN